MKAGRAEISRAVDKPDPNIRLLLLHGPDEAGSRALGARFEAALGSGFERIDIGPGELKADPARLSDEAAATSMFGSATLIRISGIADESTEAVAALLDAQAAGNPVLAYAGTLRKDSKLLKLVEASPLALHFASYPLEGRDADNEAQALFKAEGLRPSRDSIRALTDAANGDRAILAGEIAKLALYLDASPEHPKPVEPQAVAALVSGMSESDLGALVNAVFGGNPAEVERQIGYAELEGITGIPLIRAALRRLHLLADLRAEIDDGQSIESAIAAKGKAVFWKDRPALSNQVMRWRAPVLARAIVALIEAERRIKQSGSAGDVVAAETLLSLARHAARGIQGAAR